MPPKKVSNKKKGKGANNLEDDEKAKSLRLNAVHPTCVIAEEDIAELASVGQGFYSTVKVGLWTRPNKKKENVAIKCIKEEVVRDHLAEILIEANNMVKLEHDNIVKLYGICLVTRENEPCKVKLVTEYAPFGSLLAVIQDKDEEHRSFFCQVTKLWEFACHIAKGMEYLHSKNLIHFDLAARNVLVVSPNKVRITDFGLASVLCDDQKKILLEKPIAMAWCAPEVFKNRLATKGCDVWSYGVVLWEMMSFGEQPWKGLSTRQIMEQAENPGNRLPQPSACSNAIFEVMQDTWKQKPEERPSFTKIIESLDKAKPVVASAKNTYWTARPKEISFQKGTKITLIDRYGTDRYLCQNDKAAVGDADEININFKVAPREVVLSKPRISNPFDMRRTDKKAILKEYKTTGQFPVEVRKLVEIADSQGNIPVEPEPCVSKVQTVKSSQIGGLAQYTSMNEASQDAVDKETNSVNRDPTKRYSVPPPIPVRVDLHQPPPFNKYNTLPTSERRPIPKPRIKRSKSNEFKDEDPRLEWVITIHNPRYSRKDAQCSSHQSPGEESFLSRYENDMEGKALPGCTLKDHEGPELDETKPSAQTEPESGITKEVKPPDLISFDEGIEDLRGLEIKEDLKLPPLPKRDNNPQDVCHVPFPTLPSAPIQIPVTETDHPAKDFLANQSEVKEGLLIELGTDENVENHKEQATLEAVPPPLPKKHSKSSRELFSCLLPPSVHTPLVETSGTLDSQFKHASPTATGWLTPKAMQTTGSLVGKHPIDLRTLTHPSSYLNDCVPASHCPKYSIPFPVALPILPKSDPDDRTSTKPRSTSESSAENETAYGDEINEGIVKIQSQFPKISKDACYARILEYKGDIDHIIKVLQVSSLTSITEKRAEFHLAHCGWNVERTLNYILDE